MIKNLGKLYFTIIFILCTVISAGQSLSFVNIDTDPKTISMGFIDLVSDNVAGSVFSNPSIMSFNEYATALTCNYGYWQPDTFKESRFAISGSHKFADKWLIAVGLANGLGFNYDIYDNNGNLTGKYRPLNFNFKGGASYKIANFLSIGMNVGFAFGALSSSYKNMAMMTDLFITSAVSDFKFAVGAKNLGIAWDNYGKLLKDLPFCLSVGASYTRELSEKHMAGLFSQYDYLKTDSMSASIGALYSYKKLFTARVGGRFGFGKIQSSLSVGCGLSLMPFEINIAYITPTNGNNLSNTVSLSLVYLILQKVNIVEKFEN